MKQQLFWKWHIFKIFKSLLNWIMKIYNTGITTSRIAITTDCSSWVCTILFFHFAICFTWYTVSNNPRSRFVLTFIASSRWLTLYDSEKRGLDKNRGELGWTYKQNHEVKIILLQSYIKEIVCAALYRIHLLICYWKFAIVLIEKYLIIFPYAAALGASVVEIGGE